MIKPIIAAGAGNCSNGTIRLTKGEEDNEGRVEICTDGIWMTIDARYWNYNNAKVVCRQLGYHDTLSIISYHLLYVISCRVCCNY